MDKIILFQSITFSRRALRIEFGAFQHLCGLSRSDKTAFEWYILDSHIPDSVAVSQQRYETYIVLTRNDKWSNYVCRRTFYSLYFYYMPFFFCCVVLWFGSVLRVANRGGCRASVQLIIIIAMIDVSVHMIANVPIVWCCGLVAVVIGITHSVSRWPIEFKDLVLLLTAGVWLVRVCGERMMCLINWTEWASKRGFLFSAFFRMIDIYLRISINTWIWRGFATANVRECAIWPCSWKTTRTCAKNTNTLRRIMNLDFGIFRNWPLNRCCAMIRNLIGGCWLLHGVAYLVVNCDEFICSN